MAAVAGAAGVWTAGAAASPAALSRPVGHVRQASFGPQRATPPAAASNDTQLASVLGVVAAQQATVVSITATDSVQVAMTPRQIAISLLGRFGWSAKRQFQYLNWLWSHESSWNVHAENQYSGAYGIPQAVPGVKMSAAGPNWRTSARTQIL